MKPLALFAGLLVALPCTGIADRLENLTLDQAVRIALENHRSLHAAQAGLDMAEAQYRQAMAAFGPRLKLEAGIERADEDRTFTFAGTIQPPPMDVTALINPMLPPGSVLMPLAPIDIDMETRLYDRDVAKAGLNFSYPLYTGGKQAALTGLAKKGVEIAGEDKRKTELEIARDVRKYYHGAHFAERMEQLASDTLERFQALEDLTERLYQNSSLKVKKTDYLRSKTTTAMTRSMLQDARYASALTREALANAMGVKIDGALTLAPETVLPAPDTGFDALVAEAMRFNPDKQRLELAVQAADHQIADAASGNKPMVGLEASTYRLWNDYEDGLINDDNRNGWTLGVGVNWTLFDNGLTRAGVDAARAGKMRLEAQRVLLDNGLALQIKNDFLRLQRSRAQVDDTAKAREYAEENRKLNVRAYQEEMVETKDVIEAQIVETLASASEQRARHDLHATMAELDYHIGRAVGRTQP